MKSIGARLALWYMLATIVAFAGLFRVGRFLLEQHILHSLDLLNSTQFEQIRHRLGPDQDLTNSEQVQQRVRESLELSQVRFYVQIRQQGRIIFVSRSLGRRTIPDVPAPGEVTADFFTAIFGAGGLNIGNLPARRNYNVVVGEMGELRASEFDLGPARMLIATSKLHVREIIRGYEQVFAGLFVLVVAGSAGIGYGLSRLALRPVRLIQETANHISSDNLSERIPVPPVQDEISNLARLLNQMFDRLEKSFNQVRHFNAEASHELKTPLMLVRLQTEKLLLDGGLTPVQEEALEIALDEITRLNTTIEELLFLARAEAQAITLVRLSQSPAAFIDTFTQDALVLADSRGVRLGASHTGTGELAFDARWLRQVLLNLLTNALNHAPAGSTITLRSQFDGKNWRVAVEDAGEGVPAAQLERIFERFVRLGTPSETNNGSGLGLAISRSIVQLHGGRIFAELPEKGSGLRVVFEIPV
ncbi:MAG: ATP-binding protein [Opitutales bacterium]